MALRHRFVGGCALLGLVAACGGSRSATSPSTPPPATVVPANAVVLSVVDGDTVDVRVGGRDERVRLIGVDTPETKDRDAPVECWGPEASALTASLLPEGTPVRLERDVEARDDYGRLLAYVARAGDGLEVNVELARQGAAVPLAIPPNTARSAEVATAAHEARAAGRGMWGACPPR